MNAYKTRIGNSHILYIHKYLFEWINIWTVEHLNGWREYENDVTDFIYGSIAFEPFCISRLFAPFKGMVFMRVFYCKSRKINWNIFFLPFMLQCLYFHLFFQTKWEFCACFVTSSIILFYFTLLFLFLFFFLFILNTRSLSPWFHIPLSNVRRYTHTFDCAWTPSNINYTLHVCKYQVHTKSYSIRTHAFRQ